MGEHAFSSLSFHLQESGKHSCFSGISRNGLLQESSIGNAKRKLIQKRDLQSPSYCWLQQEHFPFKLLFRKFLTLSDQPLSRKYSSVPVFFYQASRLLKITGYSKRWKTAKQVARKRLCINCCVV